MLRPRENLRWGYTLETRCGIEAFNRPCQAIGEAPLVGLPCPQNEICRVQGETVYILDDDPVILEELRELVEWCGYTVKCFSSPLEFQRESVASLQGCVMLDVELPGVDGIEMHTWLRSVAPNLPVIFLSGVSSIETAVSCMRAGAVEFLVKPIKQGDLRRALTAAIGAGRMKTCRRESVEEVGRMVQALTPAEWRVAELIAQGYVTKQIANLLDRSENTTKIHRFRIFNKLGVTSSAQLVKIVEMAKSARAPAD